MEESNLTHGSLFSGIGGFELGAEMSGIKTLWNCEIEGHKRNILKRHFPEAVQYTDICLMKSPLHVDIISGGFPCQDISIANVSNKKLWENGKVKGINGERSGLGKNTKEFCAKLDLDTSSLRTAQCSFIEDLNKSFATLPKAGMTVNGNVYRLPNLASTTRESGFTVLPTPSKSNAKVLLRYSAQYKRYFQNGHQDNPLYQFQLNGLTSDQATMMYEWMMGFPIDWTREE